MVHVVKGRQYSACTYMPAPQSQKWSLRLTLDLDSDSFDVGTNLVSIPDHSHRSVQFFQDEHARVYPERTKRCEWERSGLRD
jgi:hypothetical protein